MEARTPRMIMMRMIERIKMTTKKMIGSETSHQVLEVVMMMMVIVPAVLVVAAALAQRMNPVMRTVMMILKQE